MGTLGSQDLTPTIAQQIFVIASGIAGGLAGIWVARGFSGVRTVPSSVVGVASILSFVGTLGAGIYLANKAKEGAIV